MSDPAAELARREACRRRLLAYHADAHPSHTIGRWSARLASALERFSARIEARERPRLMVFAPPQFGKSSLVARSFPAWLLGRHPDWPIILASYAASLSAGHGRFIRTRLADPAHSSVFPDSVLSPDSQAVDHFSTTAGGQVRAVGIRGGVSGQPARCIIIDDPHAGRAEATSPAILADSMQWYHGEAARRLAPGGGILLMMTRWSLMDLAAQLLDAARLDPRADQWEVLSFPAISESGESLHPERWSLDELERIRASMPAEDWSALYQQQPVPDGGTIFRETWWRWYDDPHPTPIRIVQSWDTAFQAKASADTSSCVTAAVTAAGVYILDHLQDRVEFPDLKRAAVSLARRFNPTEIIIEDKASGQSLVQELRRETRLPVLAVRPEGDKVLRARRITPMVEGGRVFLPRAAPWIRKWMEHFTLFPAHKVKDPVDSFTQLMQYLRFEETVIVSELNRSPLSGGSYDPLDPVHHTDSRTVDEVYGGSFGVARW